MDLGGKTGIGLQLSHISKISTDIGLRQIFGALLMGGLWAVHSFAADQIASAVNATLINQTKTVLSGTYPV